MNTTTKLTNADVVDLAYKAKELDESSLAYRLNNTDKNVQLNQVMHSCSDNIYTAIVMKMAYVLTSLFEMSIYKYN